VLPRGRHGLTAADVATNQRERLLSSIAAACKEKGYPAVTVKDITQGAGVSRRTFYDLFSDKEDCFLVAYDMFVDSVFGALSAAYAAGGRSWPERLGAALRQLLDMCARNPALAHLAIVDVVAAGRAALARRDATLYRFSVFLEPGRTELPAAIADHEPITAAAVGGVYAALYNRIQGGETEQLPELARDLHYCALVPFLGHPRACAASDAGGQPDAA
jgi:AcrR family transcriptional regulator